MHNTQREKGKSSNKRSEIEVIHLCEENAILMRLTYVYEKKMNLN